ncbi:MAG: patatin-like phospholipase family protein [Deltaproteobacteria bacterium]
MGPQPFMIDKSVIIRQLPLFAELNFFERRLVLDAAELLHVKRGAPIYCQGAPADALYAVVSGRVEMLVDSDGEARLLEILYRGKYFGFISLLTGEPHSVTARAATDVLLVRIDRARFERLLQGIPRFSFELNRALSRRLKRKDLHPKAVFESTICAVYGVPSVVRSASLYFLNLGLGLCDQTRKKVICVDATHEGSCLPHILGLESGAGLVCRPSFIPLEEIMKAVVRRDGGPDILRLQPGPDGKKDIECLISVLTTLINDYHYCLVLVDPRMEEAARILVQADVVHLVSSTKQEDLRGLADDLGGWGLWKDGEFNKKAKLVLLEEQNVHGQGTQLSRCAPEGLLHQPVYATLPDIGEDGYRLLDLTYSEPYAKAVRRVARQLGEVQIGLALGSGSAMGIAHIGVLKVLEEQGVEVDFVAGSSIGALIGGLWCCGYSAREVEKIILENRSRKYLFGWDDLAFPLRGLLRGRHVYRFLDRYLGDMTFHDIKRPFKIVACDAMGMKSVVFDSGRLKDAIMASVAIPGILEPYRIADHYYIDGGVINPLPTDVCLDNGAKKIIAVNVLPSSEDFERTYELQQKLRRESFMRWRPAAAWQRFVRRRFIGFFEPNIFDVIVSTVQSMQFHLAQSHALNQSDVTLHPDVTSISWADFKNIESIVRRGEEEARRHLWEIKELALRTG